MIDDLDPVVAAAVVASNSNAESSVVAVVVLRQSSVRDAVASFHAIDSFAVREVG